VITGSCQCTFLAWEGSRCRIYCMRRGQVVVVPVPGDRDDLVPDVRQEVLAADSAQQAVLGSGVQVNVFHAGDATAAMPADGVLVVGDVPQEPAAFQPRAGVVDALGRRPGVRVSVVIVVTGIRGVGKTQVAGAYARARIADRWRLVAWIDATDAGSVLAGLAQIATAAGLGVAGDDAGVLAARVRHWLEADGERRLVVFDNAVDLDGLRPFLPSAGAAQVGDHQQSAVGLRAGDGCAGGRVQRE
jgi:hypothetical protein